MCVLKPVGVVGEDYLKLNICGEVFWTLEGVHLVLTKLYTKIFTFATKHDMPVCTVKSTESILLPSTASKISLSSRVAILSKELLHEVINTC